MKIEDSQRDTIFAQLKRKGKWTGRRNGHSIRIWKIATENGLRIGWQVTRRNVNMCAKNCFTLSSAIEAINQALGLVTDKPVVKVQPPQTLPLVAASVSNYRLPYADN